MTCGDWIARSPSASSKQSNASPKAIPVPTSASSPVPTSTAFALESGASGSSTALTRTRLSSSASSRVVALTVGSLAVTIDLRYKATMPKGEVEDLRASPERPRATSPFSDECGDWLIERFSSEPWEIPLASDETDCPWGCLSATCAATSTAADEGAHRFFTTNYDARFSTLNLDRVEGMRELNSMEVHGRVEPLRRSIGDLEDSNLSRLFRVVRDWVTEAEEPVRPSPEECWRLIDEAADEEARFLTLLASGEHKLLQRKAGQERWAWFNYLSQLFLALTGDGSSLSGREFLELISKEIRKRRFARRPSRPRTRRTRAERLLRLAHSIIPHAPPRLLLTEPFLTEAG